MNLKEIKEIIDLITEKAITEFELERSGVKLRIKRVAPESAAVPHVSFQAVPPLASAEPPHAAPAAGAVQAATPPAAPPVQEAEDLHVVKSPIVGTFYAAPAPGADSFVKAGDHVQAGKVLCIIEAMKLMNEIESDVDGVIVKCFIDNGQPVEYGEPLFAIRLNK